MGERGAGLGGGAGGGARGSTSGSRGGCVCVGVLNEVLKDVQEFAGQI